MKKHLVERAAILRAIREHFDARGFLEVETPLLVPSPGLDLHLDAFEVNSAGAPRFLTTSPEYQMKRLLADGYARIYQIGRAFRRGEFGARHNPEFSILEWYRAHAGIEDVMRDTEQLVAKITRGRVILAERTIDTTPPFARFTLVDAFAKYAGIDRKETLRIALQDEDRFYRALVDDVEPALAKLDHAIFVTEYPTSQASLARKKPTDPEVAERFELYVAGLELCNGFGELVDPVEQRARFEHDQRERRSKNIDVYPIDEKFLDALTRGVPPSGGNALGVDRLVALACGTTEIASTLAFADDEL
jgi:lysyl-tRNA synthetase class 2